jgi:hypothetical protein
MPPKTDPYATPRAKAVDVLLCLLAVALLLILLLTSPRFHRGHSERENGSRAGELATH